MDTAINYSGLSTASRVRRVVTGIAIGIVMLGIVFNSTSPLGFLILAPLLAIYPILTGLIGEDLLDSGWEKQQAQVPPITARQHWFGHGADPKIA